MNKSQALRRMKKLFGDRACVMDRGPGSATTPEQRAAARVELELLRAAPTKENHKRRDELFWLTYRRRFSVGKTYTIRGLGSGMQIEGNGDTWQEAVDEVEYRTGAA